MFQIHVFKKKSLKKKKGVMFLNVFLNAMIRNMKIHNICLYYLDFKIYGT